MAKHKYHLKLIFFVSITSSILSGAAILFLSSTNQLQKIPFFFPHTSNSGTPSATNTKIIKQILQFTNPNPNLQPPKTEVFIPNQINATKIAKDILNQVETKFSNFLALTQKSGLSISTTNDHIYLKNIDKGSAQKIFKHIAINGQNTISAANNDDTLTLATSGNISITTDSNNQKITFKVNSESPDYSKSGWTDDGDVVRLTTSTDKVGIGTSSPSEKLDVNGNINISGNGQLVFSGGNPYIRSKFDDFTLKVNSDNISSNGKFHFQTNAPTEAMTINYDRVGIGVENPLAKLEVYSEYGTPSQQNQQGFYYKTIFNPTSSGLTGASGGGTSVFQINTPSGITTTAQDHHFSGFRSLVRKFGPGTVTELISIGGGWHWFNEGHVNNFYNLFAARLSQGSSGTGTIGNAYGVYIDNQKQSFVGQAYGLYQAGNNDINYFAGNVGIGTDSPSEKLEVNGNLYLNSGQIRLGNYSSDPSSIGKGAIYYNTTDDQPYYYNGSSWTPLTSNSNSTFLSLSDTPSSYSSGNLLFMTSTALANTSSLFWDNANSRFGINTTNPANTLEVNGNIGITNNGHLTFDGGNPYIDSIFDEFTLMANSDNNGTGQFNFYTNSSTKTMNLNNNFMTLPNSTGIVAYGGYGSGANLTVSSSMGEGNRFIWYPKKSAFRAGYVLGDEWDDINIGNYSVAFGESTKASGEGSFAFGSDSNALGAYSMAGGNGSYTESDYSFAFGSNTDAAALYAFAIGADSSAFGNYSLAFGNMAESDGAYSLAFGNNAYVANDSSLAFGNYADSEGLESIAIGSNSVANGDQSIAIGPGTDAEGYRTIVLGSYNDYDNSNYPDSWDANDPLLIIGNGADNTNPSTAVTLLKNGNLGIGSTSPTELLQVGESGDGTVAVANAWNTFSDIRFKDHIRPIDHALDKVLQLEGVYYDWKKSGQPSIGFIAQQVQPIIPEIVTQNKNGYLSLDYSKFTPLLVEALKTENLRLDNHETQLHQLNATIFSTPTPTATTTSNLAKLEIKFNQLTQSLTQTIINIVTQHIKSILASIKDKVELAGEWAFNKLTAKEAKVQKLCVTNPNTNQETCLTQEQLQQLLKLIPSPTPSPSPTPTPTPTTSPIPTPTPSPSPTASPSSI